MIFKRYKFIIRFTLIAVSLVSILLFYWQFHSQYRYEIEVFKNRFQEEVASLDNTLKTTTDYVEQIQLQADSFYTTSQVGYAESLLLDSLKVELIDDLPFYNLDHVPDPYSQSQVGNLTGIGDLSDRSSEFYQELDMAFSLNPILQTARTMIGQDVFAYYISAQQFINYYPWTPSSTFHFEPKLLRYELFELGTPQRNPQREKFWTGSYLDSTNSHLLVTCGAPVYAQGKFRGTVALDLRLDFLNQTLQRFQWQNGKNLLINNRQQVLGYVNSEDPKAANNLLIWDIEDVLNSSLSSKLSAIASTDEINLLDWHGNLIVFQGLHQAPWQLIHILPKSSIIFPILLRLGLGWGLLLLGLVLALVITDRLITREFISPANQLIQHIQSVNERKISPIPDIPEDWLPWFETISRVFEANQKMTAELVQKEKMSSLGQLMAGIAHEINNPINFIYGNLSYVRSYSNDLLEIIELLQKNATHDDEQLKIALEEKLEDTDLEFVQDDLHSIIRSMESGADRIRDIVVSLRSFARLDQMGDKQIDIHKGIDNTLMVLESRLEQIEIYKDYGDIPHIQGDSAQLNQVFLNLLNNSIDAVLESEKVVREIKITTRHLSDAETDNEWENPIKITISDNGVGMTPEIQAHSFDPFFTTKPVGQGTGLGLPICYQIIVDQYHGEFVINSSPEQGTTVEIMIPMTPPALRCELPLAMPVLKTND